MHNFSKLPLLLSLLCLLFFSGCGGSIIEDLGTDSDSRVPHQSWGSYRLYAYEGNGGWNRIVDLGNPVVGPPQLGTTPVVIVHGLGSTIFEGNFDTMAENLIANGATSVFGFEYDSLDPIETNGTFFGQAMDYLTQNEVNTQFRIVAHSMGCLVVRTQTETRTFNMAATDNLISFVAGPHLGSNIARELAEGPSDVVEEALAQIILNGELTFVNADGALVDVTGNEPSFSQLAVGNGFTEALNATTTHAQFVYRTVAGTDRDGDYELFNRILGTFADDGIVDVESANAAVIGQVSADAIPFDHSSIVEEQPAILVILAQIGLI